MKFYVQVLRAGEDWHGVNWWTNERAAINDAIHIYGNPDNPASAGVMAVRVVKGRRRPEIIFERVTS